MASSQTPRARTQINELLAALPPEPPWSAAMGVRDLESERGFLSVEEGSVLEVFWWWPGAGSALRAAADVEIAGEVTGGGLVEGDPAVVAFGAVAAQLGWVDEGQAGVVVVVVELAQERGQDDGGAGADLDIGEGSDQAASVPDGLDGVDDVLGGPGRSGGGEPTQGGHESSGALGAQPRHGVDQVCGQPAGRRPPGGAVASVWRRSRLRLVGACAA